MILDNKEQAQFILEMIDQINFPGKILEKAYELKQAVKTAKIETNDPDINDN